MKLLLLTAVFLFGTIGESFAQRQKITEFYLMRTDINNVVFEGNKTYYYIVGEDGGQLKDGQYTISCPQASYSVSVFPYTYKLVGSYNMTANHSKGKLNGAISSNFKMTVTSSNGQSDNEYQTITGNFTNGVPNGTFIVNAKRTLITKLNATYKNGILVGAFSCDVLGWDNLPHKYSGTLTQSGKLNGTWTYLGGTMLFQNGVLISDNDTDKGKSTPPAISALAKQYAAGSITKDALAEKGYTVVQQEIQARIKVQLEHALNFIQSQGKAFSIVYDTDFEKYLWYDKNSEYWTLDAEKVLKPFCPMVAYEIIDANRETITCRWSVQGKKKVISTYELTLKHKNGKLVIDAESFNVNLVKKTE